jgi:PadR family transcriptional regulator, regulatory protein PadR
MLKGVLALALLRLLATEESYGYEIVRRLRASGLDHVKEGTVYPALARLERDGHVSTRLVPSNSGPARKYYRPSKSGEALLDQLDASWDELTSAVDLIRAGEPITTAAEET